MTSERFVRAEQLFHTARDLPVEERERYVRNASEGDGELAAQIMRLLRFECASSVTGGLAAVLVTDAADRSDASRLIGRSIGRYRIIERLGEGGFGAVYRAEQDHPVRRTVAVKILRSDMESQQVIARFDAERQALALMEHPNIAHIFDAGRTDESLGSRPYFVMEYVNGTPITTYCDQLCLDWRRRLELFMTVCHAVQHAHQRGMIHRDLKPSNILVAEMDGVATPKVIDFGIAKAIQQPLGAAGFVTQRLELLGTPQYMSPEQADPGDQDIDTRTDIYSLGVVLYELLTGSTPLKAETLTSVSYSRIQQAIRELLVERPSTRLLHSNGEGAEITRRRGADIASLRRRLRGDLDWIMLKALEKDRERRYVSASAFADDIRRHLNHEPVLAGPPGTAYGVKKFIRRHRVGVLAAALVTLALIGGAVGTTVGMMQAVQRSKELEQVAQFQAKMLANVDPTKAGLLLFEDLHSRYDAALAKAGLPDDQRAERVEALRAELRNVNATDTAAKLIDQTMLRPAVETIDKQFKDQPLVDASLRQTLADLYKQIGLYESAIPLQELSLNIRRRELGESDPHTLTSLNNMGLLLQAQGRLAEAEPYCRQALERHRRVLGEEHPDTVRSINNMGFLLEEQGKLAEAELYHREALEKFRRVLGGEHPDTLASINNMALLLKTQGKLAEAEPYYREALEKRRRVLGEEHPDALRSIDNMGGLLKAQGRLAEAEPYYREALEKSRRVLGEEHPNTLISLNNIGGLLRDQGRFAEAEVVLLQATVVAERTLSPTHQARKALWNSLVKLYDAWHLEEPGNGYDVKAAQWRAKLDTAAVEAGSTTHQP